MLVLPRSLFSRVVTLRTPRPVHHLPVHQALWPIQTPTVVTADQRPAHSIQVRHGHRSTQINFDTIGSWNNRLDLPLNLEYSIKSGTVIPENSLDNVGSASLLGRRKENEDRYHLQELTSDTLMVSIFDGHSGSMAANFTWQHMAEHILHWLDSGVTDLQLVLRDAFCDLNKAFTRFATQNYKGSQHALVSGTTATICLLRQNHELVIGHVGDSVAILCRDGKAIRLTKDHHLDNTEEEERVKSMGATVTCNGQGKPRVNGRLDMTRSIGDLDLKPYGVIAEPSTKYIKVRHSRDAFLVLTTDGVNISLTDQEIADIINGRTDPEEAAKQVTDQALQFGSQDNATAVVMPFGAWGKYSRAVSTIQYDFGRNIIGPRYS